ncbi:MAG: hypothetical protein ACM3PP_11985 [Candidatus Saccharibacteria bacterium]
MSTLGITSLHLRNPWVIAFWSAMFPGLGHLLLSKFLRGFLLFIWEVVINVKAHINLAILYSFTGRFEMAKDVLDTNWMLLYIPTYLFAVWDSYRTAIDINQNYLLAAREDADTKMFSINPIEFNYLDKSPPWISVAWSLLTPGAGQLYIHRIVTAFFILISWIGIVYASRLLPAIHHTMLGEFKQSLLALKPQWFLNVPSVFFFAHYDAYINTVEGNKLFDWEQAKFLKNNYQFKRFKMPFREKGGEGMYIVSTFEHSRYLELAITAIQMKGIKKESILAVPMDKRAEQQGLFDSLHHSDGLSLLDLTIILSAFFTLMGAIYGFVLDWGPIIWGIVGMIVGAAAGLTINLVLAKKKTARQKHGKGTEVVLIIECLEEQTDMVKNTLWEHFAFGVRKLDLA